MCKSEMTRHMLGLELCTLIADALCTCDPTAAPGADTLQLVRGATYLRQTRLVNLPHKNRPKQRLPRACSPNWFYDSSLSTGFQHILSIDALFSSNYRLEYISAVPVAAVNSIYDSVSHGNLHSSRMMSKALLRCYGFTNNAETEFNMPLIPLPTHILL